MDALYYLFMVCGFIAVVMALEGAFVLWDAYCGPAARRVEQRLRGVSAGTGASEQTVLLKRRMLSELPALHRFLLGMPRVQRLDRFLQQSGTGMSVAVFLGLTALLFLCGLLLPVAIGRGGFITLPAATLLALLPASYVLLARINRLRRFERQLPEALELISRSMRAGHSFPSGIGMVAAESPEPVAGEFRIVGDEISFGISVQEALLNLARRVPSTDLNYFVVAVLIQRETGGNLTELLDKLSGLIRQRFRLFEKVRALSAEGRLSGWILGAMPFVMAAVMNVVNPKFLAVLWEDPLGIDLVIGALSMMAAGCLWMWRIVKIRV